MPMIASAASYDPATQTLNIERLQVVGDKNEFRSLEVKFTDINAVKVVKSDSQSAFADKPFYSSPIIGFNGLEKNSLFTLDNGLIFKVTDTVTVLYTATNMLSIHKRNDNTWFASFDGTYFNIEPFVYGSRLVTKCIAVSPSGNVFQDNIGNFWQFVNPYGSILLGQDLIIYDNNVTLINGKTAYLRRF